MIMQTFCLNLIFLLVIKIFEILPMQNLMLYLPQCDKKMPGGV